MHGLFRVDQHFLVRAGRKGLPRHCAVRQVQRRHASADAVFAARDADHDLVLDRHDGRGQRFADGRVADLGRPFLFARLGVEGDNRGVGLRQQDHAVGIGEAAVHRVAAHDRDDFRVLLRLVAPDDLAVIGQVQREDVVREGRVDIHDVPDHQRRALVPPQDAGREGPGDAHVAHVVAVDLVELRIAGVGIVAGLDGPLAGNGNGFLDAVIGQDGRTRQQERHTGAGQREFHRLPPLFSPRAPRGGGLSMRESSLLISFRQRPMPGLGEKS